MLALLVSQSHWSRANDLGLVLQAVPRSLGASGCCFMTFYDSDLQGLRYPTSIRLGSTTLRRERSASLEVTKRKRKSSSDFAERRSTVRRIHNLCSSRPSRTASTETIPRCFCALSLCYPPVSGFPCTGSWSKWPPKLRPNNYFDAYLSSYFQSLCKVWKERS